MDEIRLLIVDDEPRDLALMRAFLKPAGYEVVEARDAVAALEAVAAQPVDLALVDMLLPGMNGIELAGRLRERLAGTYVPIVMVTASVERETRVAALGAGVDDFLEKPVDQAVLLARIRSLLRLRDTLENLESRTRELEDLQKKQRELTQFIVHDLKSPLAAAALNLEFLRGELAADRADVVDSAGDAAAALDQVRAMVEDLLAIARLEQAEVALRRVPVEVGALVRDLLRRRALAAAAQRLAAVVDVEGAVRAQADAALLKRVLENLLDNAVRYTPEGGTIGVEARARGDRVEVAVRNTGAPIPAADRQRIFERFGQGGDARRMHGNVGLGLYFCRTVLRAHGGDIEVAERPPWPVSFELWLPAAT